MRKFGAEQEKSNYLFADAGKFSGTGEHHGECEQNKAFAGYPDLLAVKHLHEITGLSKQTIRSLINGGGLPGCKIGSRLYVPKDKFIAFVNGEL